MSNDGRGSVKKFRSENTAADTCMGLTTSTPGLALTDTVYIVNPFILHSSSIK